MRSPTASYPTSGASRARAALLPALLAIAMAPAARAGDLAHFNPGSLIIPMSSSFQDPCGVVSAYGLVYKVLAADDSLARSGQKPVTVHWVYDGSKKSPNRCVPTNLNKNPLTPATCVAPYNDATKCKPLPYNDPEWKNGCDFGVISTLVSPVTQIDNSTGTDIATSVSGCGTKAGQFCSRDTTTGADANLSYPTYAKVTIQHTTSATTNIHTVKYGGGAFVIDSTDAPTFLALLAGTLKVNDVFGDPIDFSTFTNKSEIGKCGYTSAAITNIVTFTAGYADKHWVNVHKAQVGFDAIDSQRMNQTPAKIALLQTAAGVSSASSGTGNGVVGDMLPLYLKSAGLNFKNAAGCSPSGYNAKNALGNCPNGAKSGYIFDAFDVMDLQDLTELNRTFTKADGTTAYVYQNFWTPHWEGSTFTGCDGTCINKARKTVQAFTTARPAGLLAECGSIAVLEGSQGANAYDPTMLSTGKAAAGWWYPPPATLADGGYADPDGGYVSPDVDAGAGIYPTRIMTCQETTPDAGTCPKPPSGLPAAMPSGASGIRGTLHDIDPNPGTNPGNYKLIGYRALRNCTDPTLAANANCIYFENPGSPYAQIGDYLWFPRYGLVSNYKPAAGNIYNTNGRVSTLGYQISTLAAPISSSTDPSLVRPKAMADQFTLAYQPGAGGQLENGAQVLYLGGHSYATDVAGTRLVLNTMLALGVVKATQETGFAPATEYNGNAFVATYDRVTSQGAPVQWQVFSPSTGEQWQFPYHTGHLRAHPIYGSGSLSVNATNKYTDAVAFSGADVTTSLPKPGERNLFTYLGGTVTANPSLGGTKRAPNNVLQTGWTPVDIDAPSIEPGNAACVDNFRIGEINSTTEGQWSAGKPNFTGTPYAGMLPGADGVCDLQEAFQLTKINLGTDNGQTDGAKGGAIPAAFLADKLVARNFAQVIRGYCYATDPTKAPSSNSDCVADALNINVSNPEVGGFVHSQPAIVPASAFITDAPVGTHRPTVLYIGGLDGQLHAFYVPSDGKDNGYTGPADTVGSYNTAATSVFKKPVSGAFDSSTKALQELWSFIPPGQLPLLDSNNAMVDSSPVAIDVFGDFDGSGKRTWHTVVVASAGGSNRELFALDVTNPLKPILLWDLQANFEDQSPFNVQFAPIPLTDDETGYNPNTQAQAFAWQNGCHAGAASCTVTDFQLPPAGSPPTTGPYNYVNLGASQSISVAQLRRNNAPLFAAFVATNEPQNKTDSGSGIYVFAVDVVTGQKVWEFNNPYNLADDPQSQIDGIGNTPPAGVTLFSKAGNSLIDTAYVGDDEGSLWELDAADGLNVNSFASLLGTSACASGLRCNFSLSQAYGNGSNGAQPISSLSTIFILPSTYPATGPLSAYRGQALLAYGTAGTDTVSGLEPAPDASGAPCPTPCINGSVHLLPLAPPARYSVGDVLATPSLISTIQQLGIVKSPELPGYPMWLTNGERVYGSIVVAGDQLFFNTTQGSVSQLDQRGNLSGAAYRMNLSASTNPLWNYVTGNGLSKVGGAGGTPLVDSKTGAIVVVTDKYILRFDPPAGPAAVPPTGPSVNGRGATPTGFLSWFFRRRGLEY